MKKLTYIKRLSHVDYLDITLYYQDRKIVKFALNYRSDIMGELVPVYRVDNFHGFLHEQKLWLSPEPIILDEPGLTERQVMEKYLDIIMDNYQRYKKYYERSKRD